MSATASSLAGTDKRRVDWAYVFRDTRFTLASAAIAIVFMLVAMWFQQQERNQYALFADNQAALHEDYDSLVYRRRLIDLYHRRYQELQSLGFVASENRLDWIQSVRAAAADLQLPTASYSLEPQRGVSRPVESPFVGDELQIHATEMTLTLGLLHEGDFLRFFARLRDTAPGLMKVDSCELARVGNADAALRVESNVTALCSLLLVSVTTSDIGRAGRPELTTAELQ